MYVSEDGETVVQHDFANHKYVHDQMKTLFNDTIDVMGTNILKMFLRKSFPEDYVTWFLDTLSAHDIHYLSVESKKTLFYHRYYFYIDDDKDVVYIKKNMFTRKISSGIMERIKWTLYNII